MSGLYSPGPIMDNTAPVSDLVNVRRLHIGSGQEILADWLNVDTQPYPGVDLVLDVTQSFPFQNVELIYAEHFIEHLAYADAAAFLRNCRKALRIDGILRLSTPNLDWVWMTQYRFGRWESLQQEIQDCFGMNKGFHGWGHQFLYNLAVLTETLHDAGFLNVKPCRYRESEHEELRGVERHEQYLDAPDLPHVIIVEASGVREDPSPFLDPTRSEFLAAVADR